MRMHRSMIVAFIVVLVGLLFAASVMAGSNGPGPYPYDPDAEPADVGSDSGVTVIRECAGTNIDGAPTILFSSASAMYYAPSFSASTGIILPPGTSYRLLSTLEVTQTDAITGEIEAFTWYEIDGPCPAGSGMTLWFPEGTPFSVVAQN